MPAVPVTLAVVVKVAARATLRGDERQGRNADDDDESAASGDPSPLVQGVVLDDRTIGGRSEKPGAGSV